MAHRITFNERINDSVHVGDDLYYVNTFTGPNETPIQAGELDANGNPTVSTIESVTQNSITVDSLINPAHFPYNDILFMFLKPEHVNASLPNGGYTNSSGLKGYYAEVELTNNSSVKQELFAIGSEVTMSSK